MKRSANKTWIVEAGTAVIRKEASDGAGALTPLEKLIYCLWVADYGTCNAGDLDLARDWYADFQRDAAQIAQDLSLPMTREAFALPPTELQRKYFELFDGICDEIKSRLAQN